jgi:hypothetical protein
MRSLVGILPFMWACHGDVRDSEPATGNDDSSVADDSDPADDSSSYADDSDTEDLGCDKLEIRYDGPDYPHVGSQWILQLWCDDALMTLTIIRFDPTDFASVESGTNVATFLMAGDGTISMQAGTHRVYKDVTVLP